jgi:hypothetical protein
VPASTFTHFADFFHIFDTFINYTISIIGGQILICVACGAELEVINAQSLEFVFHTEDTDEDEDWVE